MPWWFMVGYIYEDIHNLFQLNVSPKSESVFMPFRRSNSSPYNFWKSRHFLIFKKKELKLFLSSFNFFFESLIIWCFWAKWLRFLKKWLFCHFLEKFQLLKRMWETKTFSIVHEFSRIFCDIRKKKNHVRKVCLQKKVEINSGFPHIQYMIVLILFTINYLQL